MKKLLVFAAVAASLIPSVAFASVKHTAKAATTYECAKCHMKFSAAKAKADHYKDPMDGGKLVPIKPTAAKSAKPMRKMAM